jgi:hypothetical protein
MNPSSSFSPSFPVSRVLLCGAACWGLLACTGTDDDTSSTSSSSSSSSSSGGGTSGNADGGTAAPDAGDPRAPWTVENATVAGLEPVWGGMVAAVSPTEAYLVGGMRGASGPVGTLVQHLKRENGALSVTTLTEEISPRYCGCAMVDPNRGELLILGGRNGSFREVLTGQTVNLMDGSVGPLATGDAGRHAVGCHAVFLADRDVGYVFGGFSEAGGDFGGRLFRYSPGDQSFTELPAVGPVGRYDGALKYPVPGGKIWFTGGMSLSALGNAPIFHSDVWTLDPQTETWTEVPITGDESPAGRRYPWVAIAPDQQALVLGFGSDSPRGSTLMGDLWLLDVAAGRWSSVARVNDTVLPERGFASWLPGPANAVGLLSGGMDIDGLATQPLVFRSPFATDAWR